MIREGDSDIGEMIAEGEEWDEVSGQSKRLKTCKGKSKKSRANNKQIGNVKSNAITISNEKSNVEITSRQMQTHSIKAPWHVASISPNGINMP